MAGLDRETLLPRLSIGSLALAVILGLVMVQRSEARSQHRLQEWIQEATGRRTAAPPDKLPVQDALPPPAFASAFEPPAHGSAESFLPMPHPAAAVPWPQDLGRQLFDEERSLLRYGDPRVPEICLTFDDGPTPAVADRLLRILQRHRVPAAFFVVGTSVKKHPDVVRRMLAEGHEVGNHTQHHLRLDELTETWVRNELKYCHTNVRRASARGMAFMRPPGMRLSDRVLKVARDEGYITVDWTVGAKDYIPPTRDRRRLDEASREALGSTPHEVAERVTRNLHPGAIVLLHVNPVTVEAMPAILKAIQEQGYRCVTLEAMLARLEPRLVLEANPYDRG